ncbi:MAG: type I glutamate--ammonia ligase [Armatimonadetes bacterium CG_4_10_14_3_um_filter_66_18]|nr:type I glutamate--ammonia ligase [Armatimonadota bacterium]OIP11852.1 MAG: type I glutamate--ammonia ligase [Armatimonadetes bacterium CG2_30_66_41]PIU94488.1 MAG: type I glutamate--ammonia ligase [Armatimonadetes bacterium CG06_land_8_20_14_3_00_66_21]PIY51040.1 MAG: type I glutamate--ammonia ligase [Armatimonadetes bacterium CG_4_10_14_3_um_filter_66_18]PIZ31937.1 MAG: type I glutamate--ammonia ligase [Armatimonadetes bacterium CG_4_10_14_0_8_um_filter_66_14]PJB68015.1 MAG: type I glutama
MTVSEVLKLTEERAVKVVDFKFMDFPGLWQHFSVPTAELSEDSFESGFGFDGSSIRGWQAINESDMLVIPDPETAIIDPFMEHTTLSLICNVVDPITKEKYSRDPRNIAQKAEAYLKSTGIADTAYFGPEAEFFIFDDVRFDQTVNMAFHQVDSVEGRWNTARNEGPNLGYKPRFKEGYFPVPPTDSLQDIRSEMMLTMIDCGLDVECQHHEVATGGQCEIDMRFSPLVKMADGLMLYKYIIKNVARRHGKTATFMPKPLFQDNGSGMHTHVSLWKGDEPLFAGDGYAGLSETALFAIGGILKHAAAVIAFTSPTTNSYKRLVPGYEAPVNLAYSSRNRSAAVRIPMYSSSPKSKRVEFRCPDPSCNGYMAFSAILMAVIDGIENRLDPGEPFDRDLYDLAPEELAQVPTTPGSLDEALAALEADHDFLLKGDVFTSDVVERWIDYKQVNEIDAMRLRPHPYEFALYYDI